MTIGEKIRKLRNQAGLTQRTLGELSGTSETTIKQYELGKRQPRIEQLEKIARALDVSISHLIDVNGIIKQSQDILNDFSNHPENWMQENPLNGNQIPVKQFELLKHYNKLNEAGKDKAIERIEELTEISRYTKPDESLEE